MAGLPVGYFLYQVALPPFRDIQYCAAFQHYFTGSGVQAANVGELYHLAVIDLVEAKGGEKVCIIPERLNGGNGRAGVQAK